MHKTWGKMCNNFGADMGKDKKNKKLKKKPYMREPVVLPFEPDMPIETFNSIVDGMKRILEEEYGADKVSG